jgi:hypothetical protein
MVCLAQTKHLYYTDTNTVSKGKEEGFLMTHIGCDQNDFRAYGTFDTNRAPILCQDQHYLQIIELSLKPRHLGVPSGAAKIISEPMVRLTQTVPLSCANTNTLSKRKEVRFHMTRVT